MKSISISVIAALCCLLTACGFSPRSANNLSPDLHLIYIDTPNPDSPFIAQLERTLQSANVRLVNDIDDAPVTLHLTSQWSYDIPTILNSGYATTYTYTFSTTYQLQTPTGTVITDPKNISVTRSLIQNANQVYTPEATELMKREITRTVVILLYHDLTSQNTRLVLKKILHKNRLGKQHANTR